MESKTENNVTEQGYSFGKSMAMVFGVTAIIIGIIVGLKYLIG